MWETHIFQAGAFLWLFLLWLLLPYIINGWQCLVELNLKREGDREKTHRKVERKAGRKEAGEKKGREEGRERRRNRRKDGGKDRRK